MNVVVLKIESPNAELSLYTAVVDVICRHGRSSARGEKKRRALELHSAIVHDPHTHTPRQSLSSNISCRVLLVTVHSAIMFDTVCTLPLSADLFTQAIHPQEPVVSVGLATGHVQTFRLPNEEGDGDDDAASNSSARNGKGHIDTM